MVVSSFTPTNILRLLYAVDDIVGMVYVPGFPLTYKPVPAFASFILTSVSSPLSELYPVAVYAFIPATLLKSRLYVELNVVLPVEPMVRDVVDGGANAIIFTNLLQGDVVLYDSIAEEEH